MRALIACEGFNNEYTKGEFYPPLVKLKNGETVFERQIRLLGEKGITQFLISADTHRAQLSVIAATQPFSKFGFEWTDNPQFYRTGSIFSLLNTEGLEDTLAVSGGLVFSKSVIEHFLSCADDTAAAVTECPEDGVNVIRVIIENGYISQAGDEEDDEFLTMLPICRFSGCANTESRIGAIPVENGYIKEVLAEHDVKETSQHISHYDLVEQTVKSGVYSILELETIIESNHVQKPLVVNSSILPRFFKLYLDSILDDYAVFETPLLSPDENVVQTGCDVFRQSGCDLIISFGGDNAHDTAKLIRLYLQSGHADIHNPQISLMAIRHLAIPASAGRGSEALPTAYYTVNGQVRKIEFDGLLADFVILEPKLFETLGFEDKKSAALDALCLCVESLWSTHSNSVSMVIAEKALGFLLNSIFCVLNDNIQMAAEFLDARLSSIKAAHIGGVSVAYHLSCRLAEVYQIPNGVAAASIVAYFWRHYSHNIIKCRQEITRKKLAEKMHIINNAFGVNTNLELKEKLTFFLSLFLDNSRLYLIDKTIDNVLEAIDLNDVKNTPVQMDMRDIQNVLKEAAEASELWRKAQLQEDPPISSWRYFQIFWRDRLASSVLAEIKSIEAEILCETVKLCDENGLRYFLSYGTLLGAVRHNGFIPWNDNIEISMPMEDYKRFNKLAGQGFGGSFYIQNGVKDPYCWFDGTRVCKEHTHIEKSRDRFFYSPKRGIFITVLPMGRVSRLNGLAALRFKIARAVDAVIEYRLNPSSRKLRIRASLMMKFSRPLSIKSLHKLRNSILGGRKGSAVVLGHRYSAKQEIIPDKLIFPLTKVEFEGKMFNAPKDSDAVLKKLYGDYRELPAEPDRVSAKPIRVFLNENDRITLVTGKIAPDKPLIDVDKLFSEKRNALQAKIIKKLKGLFGPTRLFKRTLTRIAGFFRTIGIRPSANTKRLASYQNKYAGQRCFLIGNGPSLKAEDLDMLAGEITFGCNLIHKIYEQTKWRPTFYCISDSGITRTHSRELVDNIDCSTLMIREFAYRYMEVKPWDALRLPYISVNWYKVHGNMLAYHYISHATIMSMMMELAFYMGFKEIYLLGVDGTSASKAGSHFTDSYFTAAMKEYSENVKKQIFKNYDPTVRAAYLQKRTLKIFQKIREYADRKGFKVYNATRGGVIEVFERADLDRVLNK